MRILRQRLLFSSIAGSYLRLPRREDARRTTGRLRPPLLAFGATRFADLRLPPAARRALPARELADDFVRRGGAAFRLRALFFGVGFFAVFGLTAFWATDFELVRRDAAALFLSADFVGAAFLAVVAERLGVGVVGAEVGVLTALRPPDAASADVPSVLGAAASSLR
jgi:hypothetical protein